MTSIQHAQPRTSLRNPWFLVVGAALGLVVGNGPVMQFTFGVFLQPVAAEFHAGRGTISTALLVGLVATGLCTPVVGRLMDRFGIRPVALPLVVGFAATLVALGLFTPSPTAFVVLFGIMGVFAAGQTPLPYARAIAGTFDGRRGLALGIAMAGVGLGTALLPPVAGALILAVGWRGAYIGLGVALLAVVVPVLLFLIREPVRGHVRTVVEEGLTAAQAIRTRPFWILAVAFFLLALTAAGLTAHIVPLLTDRGVAPRQAAAVISVIGVALIVGRLIAGYLLDRVFAPYVAVAFTLLPLVGVVLLLVAVTVPVAIVAALLVGLGLGAEVDLIAFLLSRYLGMRAFGEIYGYLFALFMLGNGMGPVVLGASFQATGSYTPALVACAAGLVVASGLVLRLGPYRFAGARS
jgi:MFS family permease